ncbi:MAG: tetratricopeptide repeat protein [Phycisphaerales bacterium]|nr:tetratricopeptide repeat protein [Phycisphaerales bacterium]
MSQSSFNPQTTQQSDALITTTIVTASSHAELSPIEAAIMDCCNTLHEAQDRRDQLTIREMNTQLETLLDRYDQTDGENHPNPAWARANQRALALSAMGKIDQAIRLELTALKYADTPRRKEISYGNLADRCLRVGEADRAVEFFLDAINANPESVPVLITGAHSLFEAGYIEQADTIFRTFLDNPQMLTPSSELGAYLDCDIRTRNLCEHLPSLAALFTRWTSMNAMSSRISKGDQR